MMGKATTKYTPVRHAFLAKVAAAGRQGVRARGVAEGTACTAFRQLDWVRQLPMTIGIRVVITETGERALAAWERGERGELDLRDPAQHKAETLELVLKYSEVLDLDQQLLQALLLRMPMEAVTAALAKVDAIAEALTPDDVAEAKPYANGGPITGPAREMFGVATEQLRPCTDPRLTAAAPTAPSPSRTVVVTIGDKPALGRAPASNLGTAYCLCDRCSGRGKVGHFGKCETCEGTGRVRRLLTPT